MNIIIFGNRASGKTLLAELLEEYYTREGQRVRIMELGFEKRQGEDEPLLEETFGNPDMHTIVVTQARLDTIFRFYGTEEKPALYDYYYHAIRGRDMLRPIGGSRQPVWPLYNSR